MAFYSWSSKKFDKMKGIEIYHIILDIFTNLWECVIENHFAMIIFIVNLQLFYIHCQDFDDLVERMAPAAMAAVNPAQSKTESNQEQACW